MVPTQEWMNQKFDEYNLKYFAGVLPKPELIVSSDCTSDDGDCFGYYDLSDCKYNTRNRGIMQLNSNGIICLSNRYDRSELDWTNTLLHEMCHAYVNLVMYVYPRDPHGKEFQSAARKMNADGWNITESSEMNGATNFSNQQPNSQGGILCVLNENTEKGYPPIWLCRAEENNIQEFKNVASNLQDITGIEFYRTKSQKLLNIPSNPNNLYGLGGETYQDAINKLCNAIGEDPSLFQNNAIERIG